VATRVFGPFLFALGFVACGLSHEGSDDVPDGGGAGTGGTGGTDVGTGTCFPGAKVCPDATGNLVCLSAASPDTGCKATSCSPCALPHATTTCSAQGACAVDQCDAGWQDCNSDPVDGCETNLDGDPQHCGSCTQDCTVAGGPSVCQQGVCKVNDCTPPTFLDCDGDKSNGCEIDGASDPNNCLFCGNVCALAHAESSCASQQCVIEKCDPDWGDCDQNPANGCEAHLTTDPGNCGTCGSQCNSVNGVAGCSKSNCGILCNPGFGDCNHDASDGCESNFASAPLHCGACDKPCPSQHQVTTCTAKVCGTAGCLTGWADCDNKADNGCEADVSQDPNRCGSCSTKCPAAPSHGGAACIQGQCSVTCENNYGSCGTKTTCFKIQTDPLHCGTACTACIAPPSGKGTATCANFSCGLSCSGGYTACGGDCVDTKTSAANCGGCGQACPAGQSCAASKCS
jgi:hypothetical protein